MPHKFKKLYFLHTLRSAQNSPADVCPQTTVEKHLFSDVNETQATLYLHITVLEVMYCNMLLLKRNLLHQLFFKFVYAEQRARPRNGRKLVFGFKTHKNYTCVEVNGAWRAISTPPSTQYVVSCRVVPVSSSRITAVLMVKKMLICLQPVAVNLCISARIMIHFGLRIN